MATVLDFYDTWVQVTLKKVVLSDLVVIVLAIRPRFAGSTRPRKMNF
jgi:hypothetical protein